MTVLVTGGAGYIGSHMVWELLDHQEDVLVVDNLTTGFEWAIPKGVRFVNADIGDQAAMEEIIKDNNVDAIIHFAGSVVVPESLENPLMYYHNCSRIWQSLNGRSNQRKCDPKPNVALWNIQADD